MRLFATRVRPLLPHVLLGLACVLVGACSHDDPPQAPALRSVKVAAVEAGDRPGITLTGVVRQRQRADLAFESAGRLDTLRFDIGDTVKQGDVLATLDGSATTLRLGQARASLSASKAQAAERKRNEVRQQQLYAQGSVAASVVEQAHAAWEAAEAQRVRDEAAVDLARRDLKQLQIVAPFDGRIVDRRAQRYNQLPAGQAVLELEASDNLQVLVEVPLEQAATLKPGDQAYASDPAAPASVIPMVLEGISTRAQNGVVQTCRFRLVDKQLALPSGMNLNVTWAPRDAAALSIPVQALRLGADASLVQVFVYEPGQDKVALRTITIGLIDQGRVTVERGLKQGDLVVTAGVAFLSDGQAVSLFQPSSRLSSTP